MKEKHFERTSKFLLFIHLIASVFIFAGLMSQMAMSGLPPINSIIPLVLLVICLVSGLICFKVFHGSVKYVRVLAVTFSVLYSAMLLLSDTGSTFPYMIPFLFVFVLSMDKIAVNTAGAFFLIANAIRVFLTASSAEAVSDVMESIMIESIITILIFFATNKGQKLLNQFFNDSIGEVEEESTKNKDVALKIVEVTAEVEKNIADISGALDMISSTTASLNDSIEYISQGTTDTANAVGNQMGQTQEIQGIIDDTFHSAENIVQITKDTKGALTEGTLAMNNLFKKVGETIDASNIMQQTSTQLQEQTEQVRGITNIILNISSQTNLLALNASIEAARAGESGRGFSVVADEIRNLADQTRQETENITRLIDGLSSNAKEVISQVETSVTVSNEENEYAQTASQKFDLITEKINELANEISEITEKINGMSSANNMIVENINTLSSTSEEINSSTQEAKNVSEKNVQMVREFAKAMSGIQEQVHGLKAYI